MTKTPAWYRPRNVCLLLALVFVIWAGYWVVWAYRAEPSPSVNYPRLLAEASLAAQPEGRDARPHLDAAIALANEYRDERMAEDSREASWSPGYWNPDFRGFADESIEDDARQRVLDALAWYAEHGVWDHLAEIAECERMTPALGQDDGDTLLVMVVLPHLAEMRNLVSARIAEARRTGDRKSMIEAIEIAAAVGNLQTYQPIFIEALVGYAIYALAVSETEMLLQSQTLTADELRRLRDAFERPIGPITSAFEGERAMFLDIIQRSFTDDGHGNGRMIPSAMGGLDFLMGESVVRRQPRLANVSTVFLPDRRSYTKLVNELYDHLSRRAALTPVERMADPDDPEVIAMNVSWRYHLFRYLMPALGKGLQQRDLIVEKRNGMLIRCAVEHHRAVHGALPATLDDVAIELPGSIHSRSPFHYTLVESDPGYVIYSSTADGKDAGPAYAIFSTGYIEDEEDD